LYRFRLTGFDAPDGHEAIAVTFRAVPGATPRTGARFGRIRCVQKSTALVEFLEVPFLSSDSSSLTAGRVRHFVVALLIEESAGADSALSSGARLLKNAGQASRSVTTLM